MKIAELRTPGALPFGVPKLFRNLQPQAKYRTRHRRFMKRAAWFAGHLKNR